MAEPAPGEGRQYHFDPPTYLAMVRAEVPAYDALQDAVAEATRGVVAADVLDLGTGTGETARRVLAHHDGARLVGVDESGAMLAAAATVLPGADLRVGRLEDELPSGGFDLVVSALAVHHLDGSGKAHLFARVAARLRSRGRFVLADVVVPADPADAVTPLDPLHDRPSPLADQLAWLTDAGLEPVVVWQDRDLVVVAADAPATC
jgi:tRNA (cmo5U34)-methyltransferase